MGNHLMFVSTFLRSAPSKVSDVARFNVTYPQMLEVEALNVCFVVLFPGWAFTRLCRSRLTEP